MFILKRVLSVFGIFLLASCTLKFIPDKPIYEGEEDDPTVTFKSEHYRTVSFLGEIGFVFFNEDDRTYFNSFSDFEQYLKEHPDIVKAGVPRKLNSIGQPVPENIGDNMERKIWLNYLKKRNANIKWVGSVTHMKSSMLYKIPENADKFSIKFPANQSVVLQGYYYEDMGNAIASCIPKGQRFMTKPKTQYIATYYSGNSRCGFDVREVLPNGVLVPVVGIPENLYNIL